MADWALGLGCMGGALFEWANELGFGLKFDVELGRDGSCSWAVFLGRAEQVGFSSNK